MYHKRHPALIAALAAALGCVLGVSLHSVLTAADARSAQWPLYTATMAIFHFMEFFTTAHGHPDTVSADAFLLNHSVAYGVAVAAGVLEFALGSWLRGTAEPALFGGFKGNITCMATGVLLVLMGQLIRSAAMLTAGSNFTHIVADRKAEGHQLVTHGVYSVLRHPSYFAWFWWTVGTQVLLGNPLCVVLYAVVAWRFFAGRIPHEEYTLLAFFGTDYLQYAKRTIIGIPGIQSPAAAMTEAQLAQLRAAYEADG